MRILGIDYGRKRVGIAVSDPGGTIAMPLQVVSAAQGEKCVGKIAEICKEKRVERIVVGLPLNMNGSRGEMAEEASVFADRLRSTLKIDVVEWDERLSSAFAEKALLEGDRSRAFRKQVKDKIAAQAILQSYLDSLQNNATEPPDRALNDYPIQD